MKISIRTISFTVIIVVCIVAVVMAFYMQFGGNFSRVEPKIDEPVGMTEENKRISWKFW